MSWIFDFYRSPMGKKIVMAVTGLMLFGFVFGHMVGNLKLYAGVYEAGPHQGEYKIDVYGEGLRELGAPVFGHSQALWLVRIGLLLAIVLHVHSAASLTAWNRKANSGGYRQWTPQASTYASRTMRWGGVILLLFVIYHLLHLTTGDVHPDFEHGAVYQNVVAGFSNPLTAGFYVLANLALGLHLYHGLWSLFQTLGVSGPRAAQMRRGFAVAFAVIVTAGNVSFPLAVLTGLVA